MDTLSISGWLYWVGVTLYALAAVLYLIGLIWRRGGLVDRATWLVAGTLVPHGLSILLRWNAIGHGPYVNRYEVFSSDVWVGLAVFLAFQWRFSRLRAAGAGIMPLAFLLMGLGALSTAEPEPLAPTLRSYWLVIHVSFAKLAFGSILTAFGVALVYLLKQRAERMGALNHFYENLPSLARMDEQTYRFTGLGFVFLAIMIASGSIWANDAWGNYWSWDAIETWSLVTWLFYGINLHLRSTYRWTGERAAWLSVATLAATIIAFFGVAYVARGAHVEYLVK